MLCIATSLLNNLVKMNKMRLCQQRNSKSDKSVTVEKLFRHRIQPSSDVPINKVTVVGAGQIGLATVFSLLTQKVTNNIALIDVSENKVKGEMLDLQHGSSFMHDAKIYGSSKDYSITAGSKICIVTSGIRRKESKNRLDLAQKNADIIKQIIPMLVKYSPDTVLLLATNPVDIMTYVAWKLSGLPKYRVIGSGTNLDSARFRFLLSERFGVAPTSCYGYIIGEHDLTSVAVWSCVNIAGVRLMDLNPAIGTASDPENWVGIHEKVVMSAYEVIKLKGYTSWASGLSLAQLSDRILRNSSQIDPVSTFVKDEHGITEEVFLSLPCVLGYNGVTDVIRQPLNETELAQLRKSAQLTAELLAGIKI